ncbi:hypothetical protein ACOSQ4_013172 [Xanthoceras sorbifolium]
MLLGTLSIAVFPMAYPTTVKANQPQAFIFNSHIPAINLQSNPKWLGNVNLHTQSSKSLPGLQFCDGLTLHINPSKPPMLHRSSVSIHSMGSLEILAHTGSF